MQVLLRPDQPQLEAGDAPQAVSDGRLARGKLRRVADHHHVAGQPLAIGGQKRLQILAADLFFALDDEFQLHRQPADARAARPRHF